MYGGGMDGPLTIIGVIGFLAFLAWGIPLLAVICAGLVAWDQRP